jgi:uncharacterized peroxidase-related enzyme
MDRRRSDRHVQLLISETAMSFLRTDNDASRTDEAGRLRASDEEAWGFVPNFARTFTMRPAVYQAWKQLNGAIKSGMDARRYELATLGAAAALGSSYCSLAHGRVLARDHIAPADVIALVRNPDDAALDDSERAVVAFAAKVARHANEITSADVDVLRGYGLADEEIFDVALAAAARCFFSTALDATGTTPDAAFQVLESTLRAALTVGRPIDEMAA